MSIKKLEQLQYENKTLKRLLYFMMDENIHLKNRLSEILKDGFNISLLEEAENFLNRFIDKDESIDILLDDLIELDKLLMKEFFEIGMLSESIEKKIYLLRKNILAIEKKFNNLKSEFNNFLTKNI